jgi:hypothetical protein
VILKDLQLYTEGGGQNGKWKELPFDLEQPTSRLCAVALGNGPSSKVLVHNHRCIDHVMILDLKSSKVIRQSTTGNSPSARGLHTCASLPNTSKILLFGGAAQDGNMSNEVFILDTNNWTWQKVEVDDDASGTLPQPTPRASPCLVAVDENTCLVFGGAARTEHGGLHGCSDTWLLELLPGKHKINTRCKWTLLYEDGSSESPPGRNAASLTPLKSSPFAVGEEEEDGSTSQFFLLSGGWYPFRTTYDDNYVLKVSKD